MLPMPLTQGRKLAAQGPILARAVSSIRPTMVYSVKSTPRFIRGLSTDVVNSARTSCLQQLKKSDYSSYLLSSYMPRSAKDAYIAIRTFNLETGKINNAAGSTAVSPEMQAQLGAARAMPGLRPSDLKFKYWNDVVDKAFKVSLTSAGNGVKEPVGVLLRDSLERGVELEKEFFYRVLQTRKHFLENPSFNTLDDICSFGEGTYSQLNYLAQKAALSDSISPASYHFLTSNPELSVKLSDIAAHIGQGTAVATMLVGFSYYARTWNQLTLPVDLMTKHGLSQEAALRLAQGLLEDKEEVAAVTEKLKDVVFEAATRANDHIIFARHLLKEFKSETQKIEKRTLDDGEKPSFPKGISDAMYGPLMAALPVQLYLERIEKCNFDLFHKNLQYSEWRLVFRSMISFWKKEL